MRFLADENVHAKLLPFLRSLKHDACFVSKGTEDTDIAAQAKSESRILITHDTDFADTDQHPLSSHVGVILIRINSLYLEKIEAGLSNLFSNIPESELTGRLFLVFEDTFLEPKEGGLQPFPS